jgi:hypothetical protein
VACHGPGSFFARAPGHVGPPILRQLCRGFTPAIAGFNDWKESGFLFQPFPLLIDL